MQSFILLFLKKKKKNVAVLCGLWREFSSQTRDRTQSPAVEVLIPNCWTTKGIPC